MIADLIPWAELALRWLHVVTGIAWIGASFYFIWLDSNLRAADGNRDGVAGELWAVHGGGFYHRPEVHGGAGAACPTQLHWFKWEAYTTWISGFLLLALIYLLGADAYLIDRAKLALSALAGDRHRRWPSWPAAGWSMTGCAVRRSAGTCGVRRRLVRGADGGGLRPDAHLLRPAAPSCMSARSSAR